MQEFTSSTVCTPLHPSAQPCKGKAKDTWPARANTRKVSVKGAKRPTTLLHEKQAAKLQDGPNVRFRAKFRA